MRAKEYADLYYSIVKGGVSEDLAEVEILKAMTKEMSEYKRTQNIETLPAMYSLLDELDQKWRAFCRIIQKESHSELVLMFLSAIDPVTHENWMSWKRILNFEKNSGRTKNESEKFES